ncbi:MAG: hypothetical protein ABIJ59_01915 [Pseudomonadota bacterium]
MFSFIKRLFRKPRDRKFSIDTFSFGPLVDIVQNASGRFGYDKKNPIPVCGQQGQLKYLSKLRCECEESFVYQRVGSFGYGPDGHVIDGYRLLCRKQEHNAFLYLDMYHEGPSSFCPEGMSLGPSEGSGKPFPVGNFPDDILKTNLRSFSSLQDTDEGGKNKRFRR